MPNELHTMPIKVERFLSSRRVRRMRLDELGAYFLLLCEAWLDGGTLPNDEIELRATLGLSQDADDDEAWQRLRRFVVERMFVPSEDGTTISNPTQTEVWNSVMAEHARKSDAGRAGARGRWSGREGGGNGDGTPAQTGGSADGMRPHSVRIADAMQSDVSAHGNQNQSQRQLQFPPKAPPGGATLPGISVDGGGRGLPERKGREGGGAAGHDAAVAAVMADDGRFGSAEVRQLFGEWMAERRAKRRYATAGAVNQALKKLAGYPVAAQCEALRNAVIGGHQSVFPESVRLPGISGQRPVGERADRSKDYTRR